MVIKNSGKFYVITLDHGLGYSLCKFVDYTDISSFDGGVIYVMKLLFKDEDDLPSVQDAESLNILFGPVPLNKYPNVKGKGAWKLIGKTEKLEKKVPVFKTSDARVELNNAVDWPTVGRWSMIYNFNDSGDYCDYEEVRYLEMKTLYDMHSVEIRATMHYLILNNEKVEKYYDLNEEKNRRLYLQMVNTSFDKKTAYKYTKIVKPLK